MEQNPKTGLAVALGLGLAVIDCMGLGLLVTGLAYFGDHAGGPVPVGGPVAFVGDAGADQAEGGPSEAEFAHHMLAALADAGHDDYVYQPSDSTLRSDAGVVISIADLHAEYSVTPETERDALVVRTLRGLLPIEQLPTQLPETYSAAKPFLMPSVRGAVDMELVDLRAPGNGIVRMAVAPELTAALVYGGESSIQFITDKQLAEWGVSAATAWADAIANLESRQGERFERLAEGVYRSPWKDHYDTARVLLPKRLKRLRIKGDPVVFLPHRDVLIVTGSKDDEGLLTALDAVDEALGLPRATTGRAWRLRGDTWEPFLPAASSAAFADLEDYAEDARVVDANSQKAALDEKFKAKNEDLFVGTLFRVESMKTGERFTYCVLTKGVDSLIPRADWVVFIDLDRPRADQLVGAARWDDFRKMLGRAVQKADYPGPERWRVRAFPTPKQQKALAADLP